MAAGCRKITLTSFNFKKVQVDHHLADPTLPLVNDFILDEMIGMGTFGMISKVRTMQADSPTYAMKQIKRRQERDHAKQIRMISLMQSHMHPHLVNLFNTAYDENSFNTYLIVDYCRFSLAEVFEEQKKFNESQIKCIMLQLLLALEYLHKACIAHREVLPKNIRFTDSGLLKLSITANVGRFSYTVPTNNDPFEILLQYRPPEILFGDTNCTPALDMWSTGCIMAQLATHKPIFTGSDKWEIMHNITGIIGGPSEKEWPNFTELPVFKEHGMQFQLKMNELYSVLPKGNAVSSFYKHLVSCFLRISPKKRTSAHKAQEHPFFDSQPKCHVAEKEELLPVLQSLKSYDNVNPEFEEI